VNRLTKMVNGVTASYTYNAANMLLTRGSNSYTHDLNGNTLTGGGRTSTRDAQNRLIQCVYKAPLRPMTYICGANGPRQRMVVGTNTTDYQSEANPSGIRWSCIGLSEDAGENQL